LLAPLSVRYVIVPLVDGAVSTSDDPLPAPAGLLDALGDQLDLAEVYSPPNFLVYENRAWVPVRSVLTADGAASSLDAGAAALAQSDLAGATPIMPGADHLSPGTAPVPAGTLHLAVPVDRRWELTVDGAPVESRPAFGTTTAFDVETAGTATLAYRTSRTFHLVLLVQALLWSAFVLAASNARVRRPRLRSRGLPTVVAEPVFTMDPIIGAPVAPMPSADVEFDETDLAEVFVAPVVPPPGLPSPELPSPELPSPELPSPELPSPGPVAGAVVEEEPS
jgi:hypothetical protein